VGPGVGLVLLLHLGLQKIMRQHDTFLLVSNLQKVENNLNNDFYIEVYDALSISIVDIDNESRNDFIHYPRMEGLRNLCSNLLSILDEAQSRYDKQMKKLSADVFCVDRLNSEVLEYYKMKMTPMTPIVNIDDGSDTDDDVEDVDNDEVHERNNLFEETSNKSVVRNVIKSVKRNIIETSRECHEKHSLVLSQLKYEIQSLYCNVISIIDTKLDTLLTIRRLVELYTSRIYAIAVANNVFSASIRVEMVVNHHFSPILGHTFFRTVEVVI